MSDKVVVARVTSEPLSVERCLAAVSGPTVGGVGVFIGSIRDHDHGRSVTSLTYEAHPTAEQVIRELCAAVSDDVTAIAVEHRTGTLSIGDVSVVVAAGAAHRGEALRTVRELIDSIKSNAPIWKQQTFDDGTTEWVNCP